MLWGFARTRSGNLSTFSDQLVVRKRREGRHLLTRTERAVLTFSSEIP